jgi:hypothetical protein
LLLWPHTFGDPQHLRQLLMMMPFNRSYRNKNELEDCSSGGHILFLLLMVISRSHYLSLGDIFSSGYFVPLFICDFLFPVFAHIHCAHSQSRRRSSCFSWGRVQGVSWGAYRESPFHFLSLPLYMEGTSLTTSLRYQDTVLDASYIYS